LVSSLQPSDALTVREQLVACRAQHQEFSVEDADAHIAHLEEVAKKTVAGAASAVVFAGAMADSAVAYPIFAQQNYKNPAEANGKIACANCHLQARGIDARVPHEVLPDTIFKMRIDIPAKYEKRRQLNAEGEKVEMNVGAIAIMPEGFVLAPKARLPKVLKKEMKGLAWAPYSKDKPNVVVAGPVPGARYEKMILPVLAPDPNKNKDIYFDKYTFFFGGNRGRGQVYPEGNQSNNNVFLSKAAGTIQSIEGDGIKKITIAKADGSTVEQEVLKGADIVVQVGDKVKVEQQLTTNPNVGGFGQEEKDIVLQDVNRTQAYEAMAFAIFVAQLTFVLKKKQFEKVQLAEGF